MYKVARTTYFDRQIKKFDKEDKEKLDAVIVILKNNPFDPILKTHKLTGKLKGYWSCRMTYSDRLIFLFIVDDTIMLTDIGSHDEVY